MNEAYEAPTVEAVTPVDEPLIMVTGPSVLGPHWTEEADQS